MGHAEIERRLRKQLQAVVVGLSQASTANRSESTSERQATRGDLVEDAQAVEAREGGQLARERLARQAKSLLLALQRLETGSYGRCVECDDAIGAARLRAIPSATRCLACQQRFENVSGYPPSPHHRSHRSSSASRGRAPTV